MTLLITVKNILTYGDVSKQNYRKVKCFYSLLHNTLIDIYKNSTIKRIIYKYHVKKAAIYQYRIAEFAFLYGNSSRRFFVFDINS